MAIKKTSKEEIIKKALYLFRVHGYHNTSLQVIAQECGLLKGSIYHYFASKEELGVAAMNYILDEFRHLIFKIAYDKKISAPKKLDKYADTIEQYFTNRVGGCLMGNFALELVDVIPEFHDTIQQYFDEWILALETILVDKISKHEAHVMALELVARTQGCIMMYRIYKDNRILHDLTKETKQLSLRLK